MKGLRSMYRQLQNSHRAINYSVWVVVSNIIISVYGVRCILDFGGDHFISYINV